MALFKNLYEAFVSKDMSLLEINPLIVTKSNDVQVLDAKVSFDNNALSATLSLIECRLETGRTHQIRVHLAHTGHGLLGDPVYGGRRKIWKKALSEASLALVSGFSRQALHAAVLGFEHPVSGENMRFEAPYPTDFKTLLEALEKDG